ncbi:MAG: group II intron maturase-specific domain-containing protein [Micromonosporaceae bacterium]
MLRGWCVYFQPGVSSRAFQYLRLAAWRRFIWWARRKHARITWKSLRRRYCNGGWWPADGNVVMIDPTRIRTTRYRYRGTKISNPWTATT